MNITLKPNRLPRLETANLTIREITQADISEEYIAWLNNPEVTKFLEIRFTPQTPDLILKFVQAHLDDIESSMHFGLYMDLDGSKKMIGTTTVNLISKEHKTADISFVVGHSLTRGRGMATESLHAVCAYLFYVGEFHKITGGHYKNNVGSQRVFQKNRFTLEGIQREQCIDVQGLRTDVLLYGLLRSEFIPQPALLGDKGQIFIRRDTADV